MTKRGNRQRIYDAEDVLAGPVCWYGSVAGAQAHVDAFLRSSWWKRNSRVRLVSLDYPSPGMSGSEPIDKKSWRIGISPTSLSDLVVAHELTHVLVGVTDGTTPDDHEADHGPVFAGAELEVVKRFCGAQVAGLLKAEFEDQGVQVRKWRGRKSP